MEFLSRFYVESTRTPIIKTTSGISPVRSNESAALGRYSMIESWLLEESRKKEATFARTVVAELIVMDGINELISQKGFDELGYQALLTPPQYNDSSKRSRYNKDVNNSRGGDILLAKKINDEWLLPIMLLDITLSNRKESQVTTRRPMSKQKKLELPEGSVGKNKPGINFDLEVPSVIVLLGNLLVLPDKDEHQKPFKQFISDTIYPNLQNGMTHPLEAMTDFQRGNFVRMCGRYIYSGIEMWGSEVDLQATDPKTLNSLAKKMRAALTLFYEKQKVTLAEEKRKE